MRIKTQILVQSLSPKQYKKLKLYLELEGANTYTFEIYAYFETNVSYDEEALKKKLFKYIPYTETHFRRMLSDFNKSTEAFIITQEALQDQETKELLLARYYQKIDQAQLYSLPKTYHLESEAWHLNFKIGLQNAFRALKQKRNPNLDWQSLFEQLEQYYALQKSRLYLTVLSKNNLFEGTNSPQELEAWITHLQTMQHPVLQIYTLALTLVLKDDATVYTAFEAQILNSSLEVHPEQQKEMLLVALNFCLKRLNRGEKLYGKKALQVYRKGFEQGYFKEGAYISHLTYRNAVALALKEQDLEWASWAIETYKNELLPHQQ